jgi:hypothetical protein
VMKVFKKFGATDCKLIIDKRVSWETLGIDFSIFITQSFNYLFFSQDR